MKEPIAMKPVPINYTRPLPQCYTRYNKKMAECRDCEIQKHCHEARRINIRYTIDISKNEAKALEALLSSDAYPEE